MKKFLKILLLSFILSSILTSFNQILCSQLEESAKPKPGPKPGPPVPPPPGLSPSIVTDLKWSLVKYEGRYSREAIVRITATFTNVGGRQARCPDDPCRVFLRRITPEGKVEVWRDKVVTTLSKGQSIVFTKHYRVYCGKEFTSIFEALNEINCENPTFMTCVDPDYHPPQNTKDIYDDNLNDNYKKIDEKDIMNALWDFGCKPKY